MGANGPCGGPNLDARGMVGRIYVGNHYALPHTKYRSYGPHVFRRFSYYKSMGALCCHGKPEFLSNQPKNLMQLLILPDDD